MKVHKSLTKSELTKLGYAGYFKRALCNPKIDAAWEKPVNFLKRRKLDITCKRCIKKLRGINAGD